MPPVKRRFGPFEPMMYSPQVTSLARATGDYLRYQSAIGNSLSELVILLTAREGWHKKGVVDMTAICGSYTLLATPMNVARYQFSGDSPRLPRLPDDFAWLARRQPSAAGGRLFAVAIGSRPQQNDRLWELR
jgi:hypothetical protein